MKEELGLVLVTHLTEQSTHHPLLDNSTFEHDFEDVVFAYVVVVVV